MFRKLLLPLCLAAVSVSASAQVGITPIKATEKQTAPETDYKLIGAPMPRLLMIACHDTSKKKANAAPVAETIEPVKKSKKQKKNKHTATTPMAEGYVTDKDLDNGANLFVMMFNPTCSHCEEQTMTFEKNIELFKKTKVVLLANLAMKTYLPDFVQRLKTDNYAPFYIGLDSSGFIDKVFLYQALPQINIYDGQRKLLRTYTGDVAIDSLKQYIQ